MKLLIVIPAFNEEDSIASIIERSLGARSAIMEESSVDQVEITVVSDGSTDRTVEIASRYSDAVRLIVLPQNRGYGAAIKSAWENSDADYLGFIDADGTCDPNFFGPLCRAIESCNADVALGCRLNRRSRMPLVRWVGNMIFTVMLTLFSSKRVRDTASGMRVVRRSSLPRLMPLPDGLQFTPAMSARAILSDSLAIAELDMPYHERQGRSKLRIFRDGLRFLRVIMESVFIYRPGRVFGPIGVACLFIAICLMLMPLAYYVRHHAVLEWMIYRFVVCDLLGVSGILLVCASYLTSKIVALALSNDKTYQTGMSLMARFFAGSMFWLVPSALIVAGCVLVFPSFMQLVKTGATYEHWSRFIAMSFLVSAAVILIVTRIFDYTLCLIYERIEYLRSLSLM